MEPNTHIAKAMHCILSDCKKVEKNGTNPAQKYKYAKAEDVTAAIKPLLIKHGVIVTPETIRCDIMPAGKTKNGTPMFLTTVLIKFTFTHAESGESMSGTVPGQGLDMGDKGSNKAVTGAMKYMLMNAIMTAADGADAEADPVADQEREPSPAPDNTERIIARIVELEHGVYGLAKAWLAARKKYLDGTTDLKKVDRELLMEYGIHMNEKKEKKEEAA